MKYEMNVFDFDSDSGTSLTPGAIGCGPIGVANHRELPGMWEMKS
jgi:hypothetical protein